jgi:hypothetical protein
MQSPNNCPNVGWTYSLDTTFVNNGPHTIRAIECASNGCASTARSIVVSNTSGSMIIDVDSPRSNATYNGTFMLSGWVVDNVSAIKSVTVSIDGLPIAPAQYGVARPDVCAVFPGRAGCPNVGWSLSLDTTAFSNGSHILQISALSSGNVHVTNSLSFSIAN